MLKKEVQESKKEYQGRVKSFTEIDSVIKSLDSFVKNKVDEDISITFSKKVEEKEFSDNKKTVVCYNIFLSKKESSVNLFSLYFNQVNEDSFLFPAIFLDKLIGISPFENDMILIENDHALGVAIESIFKNSEFFSYVINM